MTTNPKKPKPRKWHRDDAPYCLACSEKFKAGDDVRPLGACCIHAACFALYVQQCKELGIDP